MAGLPHASATTRIEVPRATGRRERSSPSRGDADWIDSDACQRLQPSLGCEKVQPLQSSLCSRCSRRLPDAREPLPEVPGVYLKGYADKRDLSDDGTHVRPNQ